MKYFNKVVCFSLLFLVIISCIKTKDLYGGEDNEDKEEEEGKETPIVPAYIYPFKNEVQNVTAEIIIKLEEQVIPDNISLEIPYLKYNKSWLFLLTQDDCRHASYSCMWAAINGKPISNQYYYSADQLRAGDIPPDVFYIGKTLGSTDGTGQEVRFAITTTLDPESGNMNSKVDVKPGYKKDYYRFYEKKVLVWNNIIEMLNYGCGIALHDVNATDVNDPDEIAKHYVIAQDSVLKKLSGRGCKMLAEPNGNKNYVDAAMKYAPINTITAQSGAVKLRPLQVDNDLKNQLLERRFNDNPETYKNWTNEQMLLPQEERQAIYAGVHNTSPAWAQLLVWLNDNYGKDGDDSVWFPSQDEYYEYNYYRIHGTTHIEKIDARTIKLTVNLPSDEYFYYPSITVNLKGLKKADITSITSDDAVTGLSYGDYNDVLMLNIDCRRFLVDHAIHFVELYEKNKSNRGNKADALYFVNKLKDSETKTGLLERVR